MDQIIKIFKKLDTSNYDFFIFSIGVYNDWNQVFPILKNKSVIFAIDSMFAQSKHTDRFEYRHKEFYFDKESGGYVNSKDHIIVYIIPHNIESDCKTSGEVNSSYLYSFSCQPKSNTWKRFYMILQELIQQQKYIYINNRAFFNTNTFVLADGKHRRVSHNEGVYFEFFPELGFILNILYLTNREVHICIFNGRRFLEIGQIKEFSTPNPHKDKWLNAFSRVHSKQTQISVAKRFSDKESIISYITQAQLENRIHKIQMPRDNSCLFHCFAIYVKMDVQSVRREIVEYERNNMKGRIIPILKQTGNSTFEQYLRSMSKPDTWGGEPEIYAFVELFGFNVAIINSRTGNITIFMNPTKRSSPTIFFYYVNGNHYDVASISSKKT